MLLTDAKVYRVGDLYSDARLNYYEETNGTSLSVLSIWSHVPYEAQNLYIGSRSFCLKPGSFSHCNSLFRVIPVLTLNMKACLKTLWILLCKPKDLYRASVSVSMQLLSG